MKVIIALSILLVCAHAQYVRPKGQQYVSAQYNTADYTRNLYDPKNIVVTPAVNVTYFDINTNPVLGAFGGPGGGGVSTVLLTFAPCGTVYTHVHPRAAKSTFVLKGQLREGRIQENFAPVQYLNIFPGDIAFVAQGVQHFVQNVLCSVSQVLVSFNNEDGGTVSAAQTLFNFDDITVATTLGITTAKVAELRQTVSYIPTGFDRECLARCAAAPK